jgi:transcriptional regulator with XRE-family HTH domain
MENFGEYLYKLRTQKDMSQQKLADLSSYTQTYISLIETGKVKPSKRCQNAILKALEDKLEQ